MAYATPEQMASRYDVRRIGDLLRDDETRVPESEFSGNARLLDALERASGQVRSAATVADRYKLEDLQKLADAQDEFLVNLVCSLAFGILLTRRGLIDREQWPIDVSQAKDWLAAIRLGERILNVPAVAEAGVPSSGFMSLAARQNLNLISDQPRFFPPRRKYGP